VFAVAFAEIALAQRADRASGDSAHEVSVADYRKHLESLDNLVVACQRQRSACDPEQVGGDERVRLTAATEPRAIRYGWLRLLLERAAKDDGKTTGSAPTVIALLGEARERLAQDWKQAASAEPTPASRISERQRLQAILAGREYLGVKKPSIKDQMVEKLLNWLNEFLAGLERYGVRFRWVPAALRGLLLAGILLGLGWALVRMERRSRILLVPELVSAVGTPSAREWQMWLTDAQAMAAAGRWREAIHFVYWASISRLESGRLWPADQTRTPREYLSLVPDGDGRKASLTALTRSFEQTWYGGRAADAAAFQRSLALAAELGVE
jgi:hypothetical protein